MRQRKISNIVWLCYLLVTSAVCHADAPCLILTKSGCTLQARAYFDPRQWASSRYDLAVMSSNPSPYQWDFTLDQTSDQTPQHHTALYSEQSRLPYGKAKETIVRATLHQYDTLEERITFHDLDLQPIRNWFGLKDFTPRFLLLKDPLTATTPSGIRITLPVQKETDESRPGLFMFNGLGSSNALFIEIETSPSNLKATLLQSPLYHMHHLPVSIQLACEMPNQRVYYYSDNTSKSIAVELPNFTTATHLDSLTFIVRQRANLQTIPVVIKIPVTPQPSINGNLSK